MVVRGDDARYDTVFEDDHVVETLTSNGADYPFDKWILVWSKYSNAQRVSSLHLSKGCLNPPSWSDTYSSSAEGVAMDWKTMLSYISGSVDAELLLRNEYLVAENRVLRNQLQGRLRLTDGERLL